MDERRSVGGLLQDRSGNVAVYTALIGSVLMGMVGLALDGSRAMITHSEARGAADAAALAAASQLDKTSDAFTRATNAAQGTLVRNSQRFGEGANNNGQVQITQIRFLKGLPNDDSAPITSSYVTTKPAEASYVEVTTEALTHNNSFLMAVGAPSTGTVRATAVAGFKQVVCRLPPMMICNPAEKGGNVGAAFNPTDWVGRQIRAKGGGQNAWAPGNFGLLQPPKGKGGADVADMLARVDANNACYGSEVDTKTGVQNSIRQALNVRFDQYEGSFGQKSSDPAYRPARNVTKRDTCGAVSGTSHLPRDNNVGDANPFGNGVWASSCMTYWAANHGSETPPPGCATGKITRYELYQYELANKLPTSGAPQCYKGPTSTLSDNPDRRVLYLAVVNCVQQNIKGHEEDVPTVGFVKTFMTEPAGGGSDPVVYLEVVDAITAGEDDDVVRDEVQLYR